ncbi:MAG: hypothetical protein JSU81_02240 [Candidatus Coatesbacteria bacterium]|nr:MAG: hypothetical protein JSU81_02240 [Candidatus Coatesbacteria bacterium]
MEKKLLDVNVEEKDGEYIIRVKGDQAKNLVNCMLAVCCSKSGPEGKDKADANCC